MRKFGIISISKLKHPELAAVRIYFEKYHENCCFSHPELPVCIIKIKFGKQWFVGFVGKHESINDDLFTPKKPRLYSLTYLFDLILHVVDISRHAYVRICMYDSRFYIYRSR